MKKFLLLTMVSMMTVFAMAIGRNDGSTKANAIDFDWDGGHVQVGDTVKWYRVDLTPLYSEENPALTLYMVSQSLLDTVDCKLNATVAGQSEEKTYTIMPGKTMSWTANASMLVRLKQTEVYLTLKTTPRNADSESARIKLSAKVYDAIDLDEACKNAKLFDWTNGITQSRGAMQWFKVDLKKAKAKDSVDVCIAITNTGSGTLNLRAGQSLDCPSSGMTKRSFVIAAGQTVYDTIPLSMIKSVAADELYVTFDNNQPIAVKANYVAWPPVPLLDCDAVTWDSLPVVTNQVLNPGKHYLKINVQQMNDSAKYEPEFTFRNNGDADATINRKMSFECPVWGWQGDEITLAAGTEKIEVIKKNVVEGITVPYIYLVIENDQPFTLIGRYKHVREGKACKSNIDFNWETGHTQDGKTTQWYAIDVTEAKDDIRDIKITVKNLGYDKATVNASLAFSCPYIDLQEITRTLAKDESITRKIGYSTYAMMSDTIWVGVTTDQDIQILADTSSVETKPADPNDPCLEAIEFNWDDGAKQSANDTVWYKLGMNVVRELQQFPTIYVRNLSSENEATIYGALSLECPDTIPNQERSLKIAKNGTYSKKISRNMFENIKQDTIYLRVVATEDVAFEIRLTEEAEGASCTSAIRFNWVSGNDQAANANLWYAVDLREAMQSNKDIHIKAVNKGDTVCKGTVEMAYTCPYESTQSAGFKINPKDSVTKTMPHSSLETLTDSTLYVRVYGNTPLHFDVRMVDPAHFDTIECAEIEANLTELKWNTLYTQKTDTAWYLLKKESLDSLFSGEVTPEAHAWDTLGRPIKIKAEIAYHCPVTATMMNKQITLTDGEYVKKIDPSTAQQLAGRDTVLVRIITDGAFKFEARLVSPWTGNDPKDALRIDWNKEYVQEANTIMWYRIRSHELKQMANLDGKSLHVETKNHGGKATVEVAVYEDIAQTDKEDMIEYYTGRKASRTIPAGKSAKRNIPGYVIKGLADKELYIRVKTDQRLTISSTFSDYATLTTPIQTKDLAQLAVPNVDYDVPAGGKWFAVCLPYIRNNYKITKESKFTVTNPHAVAVKVSGTATWMDTLIYDIPRRERSIKANASYEKTFYRAIEKGLEKAGITFSLSETDPAFVDSMVREYITEDSLTMYIYFNAEKDLKFRIDLERTTAESCNNAMMFDWEHGNVNEADTCMWYKVELDSTFIPKDKDILLHVENWSSTAENTTAEIRFMCDDVPTTINQTIAANGEKSHSIDRDLIDRMEWPNYMFIKFTSEQTTHIWAELVPAKPRDSLVFNEKLYLCDGATYTDTLVIPNVDHVINYADASTLKWTDKIEFQNDTAVAVWDSIVHFTVIPLVDPTMYNFADIPAASMPVIKKGNPIDVTAATTWLNGKFAEEQAAATGDSIKKVDTLLWEWKCKDCTEFAALPATALDHEAVVLRFVAVTQCEDSLYSDDLYHHIYDTVEVESCKAYKWDATGVTYTESTTASATYHKYVNGCDSISVLDLTITPLTPGDTTATACNWFIWHVTGDTLTATGDYVGHIDVDGCDSTVTLHLTVNNPYIATLPAVARYGNRLLMIDRNAIKEMGWNLPDSIDAGYVQWFKELLPNDSLVGTGYYYTSKDGSPLVGTYYARIEIAATTEGECGQIGETNRLVCAPAAGAPALMPSLAKPNEDILVVNLDPEKETVIRVFTTEGLVQSQYVVRGESTYTIKAAADHGFYLVELSNDSMNSTLRYIVK